MTPSARHRPAAAGPSAGRPAEARGSRRHRFRAAGRAVGVPLLLAAVVTAAAPGWGSYTIRRGDTLSGIAARYGTTVARLVEVNDLPGSGGLIIAGRTLKVPVRGGSGAASGPAAVRHRVAAGDTVIGIARRYGVSTAAVVRANRLPRADYIRAGQVLVVPGGRGGSGAAAAPGRSRSQKLPNSFAGRTYPDSVVGAAARNRDRLASRPAPSKGQVRDLIVRTARAHGVDPALALAISWQESGWNQRRVSVANAIGAMQVIPASGDWASSIIGRRLDLLDVEDNVTAGVVILRVLLRSAADEDHAIASYYQGLRSVRERGMFADTKAYVRNVQALKRRY